jgi:hypothetical protein
MGRPSEVDQNYPLSLNKLASFLKLPLPLRILEY